MNTEKQSIQSAQYNDVPYHHIPKLVKSRNDVKVQCYACWDSGIEYMCYMLNIVDKINKGGISLSWMLDVETGSCYTY